MGKNKISVSILVPIYSVEKYIRRCADSLMSQTYGNIEYVFVDDCTPDNSITVLKSVIDRYPNRRQNVTIIHHKVNRGLGAARNTAIKAAKGDFVIHVDSDDWVDKDFVSKVVEAQMYNDADIVFCDYLKHGYRKSEHFKRAEKDVLKKILSNRTTPNIWGCLIRRSLYDINNIRVEEGTDMGEDFQVMPMLVYYARQLGWVHEPLVHYNAENENSYTLKYKAENYWQAWRSRQIVRNFFCNKNDYSSALDEGDLYRIVDTLKNSSANGDKRLFSQFVGLINKDILESQNSLSFGNKLVLKFRNYYICRNAVRFSRWSRKILLNRF